jgi:hypothetical protein
MDVTRSEGDHLETSAYHRLPEVPAGELESSTAYSSPPLHSARHAGVRAREAHRRLCALRRTDGRGRPLGSGTRVGSHSLHTGKLEVLRLMIHVIS